MYRHALAPLLYTAKYSLPSATDYNNVEACCFMGDTWLLS